MAPLKFMTAMSEGYGRDGRNERDTQAVPEVWDRDAEDAMGGM